ncbi:MAG: hypothetical protein Q8R15_01885 [Candidatus Micrarchaeota archaeon]|nr:hypothetical protein [Candidatus Micrarchaeota archaeon]
MDLTEQETIEKDVELFLQKKLKGKIFHAVIALETNPGTAFVFEAGTLEDRTPFQAWKAITNGLNRYIEALSERFNTPDNIIINKPFELK